MKHLGQTITTTDERSEAIRKIKALDNLDQLRIDQLKKQDAGRGLWVHEMIRDTVHNWLIEQIVRAKYSLNRRVEDND